MSSLKLSLSLGFALLLTNILTMECSAQIVRKISGNYSTPAQQGTFVFNTVKAVRVVNVTALQGNFIIAGKSYPGMVLPMSNGGLSMVWYYGVTGIPAGQAVVYLQTPSNYSGTISLLTRRGVVSSEGTLTVTATLR